MRTILFSIFWVIVVFFVDLQMYENFAPITMGIAITIILIETICFIFGFLLILLVSERHKA